MTAALTFGRGLANRAPVAASHDFKRIQSLPKRTDTAYPPNLVDLMTQACATPLGIQRGVKLREVQAKALYDLGTYKRGFFPMRVGSGKTLVTFLGPRMVGASRPLLVTRAALIEKTDREWRRAAQDWKVSQQLRFMSYELLGRVSGANKLDVIKPDLILLDECHMAKNKRAAVTRRLMRYIEANRVAVMVVALSGTMMKGSIQDFAHLLEWTHGNDSPLPVYQATLIEWSEALDEGVNMLKQRDPGVLLDLMPGAYDDNGILGDDNNRRARRVFQRRMEATPGIVISDTTEDFTGSLIVEAIEYEPNEATTENFRILRETMCRPDGWALAEAMHVWAVARQLALGLHYCWWEEEKFKSCLQNKLENTTVAGENGFVTILNSALGRTHNRRETVTRISRSVARMTASGIGVGQVLGALRQKQRAASATATGSPSGSTTSFGQNTTELVTYVEKYLASLSPAERSCPWTTATSPDEFEDFFARAATVPSAYWATLLKLFPELWSIFDSARAAAEPPEKWLDARKQWAQFVRDFLARPDSVAAGIDSELQVANGVLRGEIEDEYGVLEYWRSLKDTFTINPKDVWHDDTALKVCAQWIKEHPRGIVWCEHQFFARTLARVAGVSYYGARGLDAQENFIEDHPEGPIVASMAANCTGRNLQYKWSDNLFTAPPADSERWEQAIARTHRPGQVADTVTVDVLVGCREHLESIPRALSSSDVKMDLFGFSQKLRIADICWPEATGRRGPRWA